jgi:radical S-adenosyl methionine domain-containing protein 2
MEKINFAGGEPFLKPKFLGELVKYCKEDLQLNVSIVSNGSKITEGWFVRYGSYVDILAISCDRFLNT